MISVEFPLLSLKNSIEAHFNILKIFVLYFYDVYTSICAKNISAEARFIHAEEMSL